MLTEMIRPMTTTPRLTPQQAHDALSRASEDGTMDPVSRAAWQALNAGLLAGWEFPVEWQRLSALQAGRLAGKPGKEWSALVTKGYAPPHDGLTSAGYKFWHRSTVERWIAEGYRQGWGS